MIMVYPRHSKFTPPKSPREYEATISTMAERIKALEAELLAKTTKTKHSVMDSVLPDSLFTGSFEQCLSFVSRAGLTLGQDAYITDGEVA